MIPVLAYPDVRVAAEWLCEAFGFRERLRIGLDTAVAAGALLVSPPAEYPFGERQYTAEDLAGYRWTFSQSVADVDPVDWGGLLVGE